MSENSVTRAMLGWPIYVGTPAHTDQGIILHYDGANQHLEGQGERTANGCRAYWNRTRKFHMEKRGWKDIGYAYGVCPHGYVYTGRGYGVEQAAAKHDTGRLWNGNSRWVNVTLMSGPDETPTKAQIAEVRSLRHWLMNSKGMRGDVKFHGEFSDTDCPGGIIVRMVRKGIFE